MSLLSVSKKFLCVVFCLIFWQYAVAGKFSTTVPLRQNYTLLNSSRSVNNQVAVQLSPKGVAERPLERVQRTETNPNLVVIEVSLRNSTSAPVVDYANLKYNKEGVFNFEMDDNSGKAVDVFKVLNGGTASNGVTYPGNYHTDGCGNKIHYRGAVALNLLNNYNQDQIVNTASGKKINQEGLNLLVANKWTLENHGYAHSAGNTLIDGDIIKNIHENTKVFYAKMAAAGLPYRMRVAVTPTNDEGYHPAAKQLGYIGLSTQTPRDDASLFSGYGALVPDWSQMLYTHRSFNDDWSQESTDSHKEKIDRLLLAKASVATPQMFRLGTHGPVIEKWAELMDYLQSASNDRVWVPSLQELIEYFEVKRLLVKTTSYNADTGKLTITLDYSNIPEHNKFRDVSLLIKGAAISTVEVKTGSLDNFTFNPSTGLVNLFKEKTTFADPAREVLPPVLKSATLVAPEKVRLVFDRSVSLSKDGFTIKSGGMETPVAEANGSGAEWELTLQDTYTTESVLSLYYRMQRGTVIDSKDASYKVGSYIGKNIVNSMEDLKLSGVLPVELISFEVKRAGNVVEVTWATASEKDNDFFEVQQSEDGKQFQAVGERVKGAGTTFVAQSYAASVAAKADKLLYFRLKQVDFDGSHEFSKVVAVKADEKTAPQSSIAVYPNPSSGAVYLTSSSVSGTGMATLFNSSGSIVLEQVVEMNVSQPVQLNLAALPSGMYVLRLVAPIGTQVARIVKQ